jgi:hypothetical protein
MTRPPSARVPAARRASAEPIGLFIPASSTLLSPADPALVLCLQMAKYLVTQGFSDVSNVTGGIAGYSLAVDSSIPQY